MHFFRTLGTFEYTVIIGFILLYLAYGYRLFSVSRILKYTIWKTLVKLTIRAIIMGLLLIVFLGPSFGARDTKEFKVQGRDIFFAVDLSKSMDAEDIVPSRILKVKYEIKRLIESFKADRVGLIIFTSEAYVQCPLTYDHKAFQIFLETIDTRLIASKGTDFSAPFQLSLSKFINDSSVDSEKENSRILILVSDGEDFGENTSDVVSEINNENIQLFCLGIGTKKGGRIKTRNGYKVDKNGKEVITKLDASSLESLADSADGEYFEISNSRDDVDEMIEAIKLIKGNMKSIKKEDVKADKYYLFLALAICLLALDNTFKFNIFRL